MSTKLGFHSNFRIRNAKSFKKGLKMSRFTRFSSGKFLDLRKYACVKDLTNIMSEHNESFSSIFFLITVENKNVSFALIEAITGCF